MRRTGAIAVLLVLLALRAGPQAAAQGAAECAALAGQSFGESGPFGALMLPARDGVPEHCRITTTIRPAIGAELRLPTNSSGNAAREGQWNRRLLVRGCGGFCGSIDTGSMLNTLRAGFAVAATDAGHVAPSIMDGAWAASAEARVDFAWRAVHETTVLAKEVIGRFYREAPARSFFFGCSNGGRQGLIAAQRFPEDFDGILAGAPALDWTGMGAGLLPFLTQADTRPDGRPLFPPGKVRLVAGAVARACGDRDGVIADPRACRFRPATLQCRGPGGPDCLSEAEVGVLERWYAGPGEAIFPGGVPYGSEPFWPQWLTGDGRREATNRVFAREFLRWLAFDSARGPGFSLRDYVLDRDFAAARAPAALYDATSPDLSAFAARGGKLLIWQGWADAITTPERVIRWYEAVRLQAGGNAQDFARLFVVPGMDHCGSSNAGPGPDLRGIEPGAALFRWVEQGDAPDTLFATKRDSAGNARWTRPVCAWPKMERDGICVGP